MDENPNAFKHLLGATAVARIEAAVTAAAPDFDAAAFHRSLEDLGTLELKQRVSRLADALVAGLRRPYPELAAAIVRALPPPVDPDVPNQFGFWIWPLVHVVGREGLEHPELALDALRELTQRFSAEFDVRPYLVRYPELTLARLRSWVTHPDKNVRRLVSEGTRPRLPWGERLPAFVRDPSPTLPLLEALRNDPSEFVRRSVANHLGDIAKDHPDLVVATLARWLDTETPPSRELLALARHAARHLIKVGHPGALALFGHAAPSHVRAALRLEQSSVVIGHAVCFEATVTNEGQASVTAAVDYAIRFANAAGALTRRKVFKLAERRLEPGAAASITKRHPMRPVSIRALFPGAHVLELQVNGVVLAEVPFTLAAP